MNNIYMIFIIIIFSIDASNIKVVKPIIGHPVDFSEKSIKIFNKYFNLNSIHTLDNQNDVETINKKYGYSSKYDSFYDDLKSSIWEVYGEADGNMRYDPVPYKITSSSFLNDSFSYRAENLCDNNFKTAWVEGVKGYGIGEIFQYFINNYKYYKDEKFEKINDYIPPINEIRLFNGYVKSEKAFKENSRIKKLKMYVDGQPWVILELADTTSQQIFEIPEIKYLKIKNRKDYKEDLVLKFEILEVYKGTKYEDTCLTELLLYTYSRLCFPKSSKVTMSDNIYKNIEDLKIGDKILSYNEKTKTFFEDEIVSLENTMHNNYVEYDFGDKKIIATEDHPFLSDKGYVSLNPKDSKKYRGYEYIEKIKIGDILIFNDKNRKLKNIKSLNKKEIGYTITRLKKGNNFLVNGAVVGVETLLENTD
jgi:hypothetical protein